jgi:hypothetical protein
MLPADELATASPEAGPQGLGADRAEG